jgi:glycosyltransferase involved in cell wall biosynthesis
MAVTGAPRLLYLINARLPTEKAHGYQVAKMCQAFAAAGCDVELWHPRRRQGPGGPGTASLFAYYGIPTQFRVRTLPNLDVVPVLDRRSPRVGSALFHLHAGIWGLLAARAARRRHAALYYTRDLALAFWLVFFGCPTVCELHRGAGGAARWILRAIAGRRSLRGVVAITAAGRDEVVAAGVAPAKALVAADGVDLAMFDGLPSRAECRDRLGLSPDRPIVGYVGRLRTMGMEKGVADLVRALRTLPASLRSPLLLCVGGPPEAQEDYRQLANRLGLPEDSLRFVDRVANTDVPLWIRACDVVTLPFPATPYFERFPSPMKLFEYLASGVPILASDLPSIREVLTHNETAWLVPPGYPEATAAGLVTLLENDALAARLAAAAHRLAPEYSWNRRAAAILASAGLVRPPPAGSGLPSMEGSLTP